MSVVGCTILCGAFWLDDDVVAVVCLGLCTHSVRNFSITGSNKSFSLTIVMSASRKVLSFVSVIQVFFLPWSGGPGAGVFGKQFNNPLWGLSACLGVQSSHIGLLGWPFLLLVSNFYLARSEATKVWMCPSEQI